MNGLADWYVFWKFMWAAFACGLILGSLTTIAIALAMGKKTRP